MDDLTKKEKLNLIKKRAREFDSENLLMHLNELEEDGGFEACEKWIKTVFRKNPDIPSSDIPETPVEKSIQSELEQLASEMDQKFGVVRRKTTNPSNSVMNNALKRDLGYQNPIGKKDQKIKQGLKAEDELLKDHKYIKAVLLGDERTESDKTEFNFQEKCQWIVKNTKYRKVTRRMCLFDYVKEQEKYISNNEVYPKVEEIYLEFSDESKFYSSFSSFESSQSAFKKELKNQTELSQLKKELKGLE